MAWNVVRKVAEREARANHLVVEEPSCDLAVHLGCLLGLLRGVVLDRPLCSTHLLEHVDGKHVHREVNHVVDHDCHKKSIEIIGVFQIPDMQSFREHAQISLRDPDGHCCLQNRKDKEQEEVSQKLAINRAAPFSFSRECILDPPSN